jgi:hypothetical protein
MTDRSARRRMAIGIAAAVICVAMVALWLRGTRSSSGSRRDFEIVRKDGLGDLWTLALATGQSFSRLQRMGKQPGLPLLVKVEVTKQNRNVSLDLVLEGRAGEKYSAGIKKNGRVVPPPRYRIVDESGAVLKVGTFEYG